MGAKPGAQFHTGGCRYMKWPFSFGRRAAALGETKANPVASTILVNYYPRQFSPRNYLAYSKEGYEKNAIVHRCISVIAKGIASINIDVYQKTGTGRKLMADKHPLKVLLDKPNPTMGGARFFEYATSYYLIAGNVFIIPNNINLPKKLPTELWFARPDKMKVYPGQLGYPAAYEYENDGSRLNFPVDQITGRAPLLHIRAFHPREDFLGLSKLEAACEAADINNAVNKWNYSLLENGARPSGFMVNQTKDSAGNPLPITPDQRAQVSEIIGSKYAGSKNAGRPIVLDGGWDWKETQLTPKEMDYINNKNTSARDICAAFDVLII